MPSNAAPAPAGTPRGAAVPGRTQEPAAQGTDWKWTIGRALIMYVAMNAVMNPNSPVQTYFYKLIGREPPPKAPLNAESAVDPAASSSPSIDPNSAAAAQPGSTPGALTQGPKVPSNIAIPAWSQDSKLDFYVYITSAPPVQEDDLKTQYSDVLPDHTGVKHAPTLPFDAFGDLQSLLEDPVRDVYQPRIQYPSGSSKSKSQSQLNPLAALKWSHLPLTDTSMTRDADLLLQLDECTRKYNGSIWADIIVTKQGVSPNPNDASYQPWAVYRTRKLLSRLLPLKKKREVKNLFDKDSKSNSDSRAESKEKLSQSKNDKDEAPTPIVGHWHRNLTLALIQDDSTSGVQLNNLPPPLLQHVSVLRHVESNEMVTTPAPANPNSKAPAPLPYVLRYPTVFPNDFWLLKEQMHPINDTLTQLPLHINLYRQSWFKFQVLASMSDSFDKQQSGVTGGEIDMIKTMLLETNPWFLALTIIVSVLHSLFEFLAFSSDVSHWRNKDNLAGVSVGSILTNVVVQLIITLYLLDNNEDTSWMILAGQAVGVLIECWKLTKAVTVGLQRAPTGSWIPYRIKITDKHVLSEEEKKTQEFDKLAFKYVGIVVTPLLIGYTIYSALYQTHRGWWSFVISTATSFVYAFGFVSLVPQLIVNYKLKSTAGMNHKTFVYKILGTFVDDLFAFCIKMPTLHRLACFRDDIVFFIFLYQRWIYGVDPTRRNEFGQVVEKSKADKDDDEKAEEIKEKGDDEAKDADAKNPKASSASATSVQASTTNDTLRSRSGK